MHEAVHTEDKTERLENIDAVKTEVVEHFGELYPEQLMILTLF